jgi:hypothetical protein
VKIYVAAVEMLRKNRKDGMKLSLPPKFAASLIITKQVLKCWRLPPRNVLSKHRNTLLPIFTHLYKEARCYWENVGSTMGRQWEQQTAPPPLHAQGK